MSVTSLRTRSLGASLLLIVLSRHCVPFVGMVWGLLLVQGIGQAGDWPGWRGPTGLGCTAEKDLPLTWDGKRGENILWKVPIAGGPGADYPYPGQSSPIVWRDRVFITTAIRPDGPKEELKNTPAEHHVICYRASDGRQLWNTLVPPGKCLVVGAPDYIGYAVSTPATDGTYIFALFGSGVIAALDFDGKIVWRQELPRLRDADAGVCCSLVLYEDSVIIPGFQDMRLRALNKKSGELKWEQKTRDRNTMATPVLVRIKDKTQLIHCAGGIQSTDPDTGELIWSCRVTTKWASPVFGDGLLYVDAGEGNGQVGSAIDPTGKGDVSKTHVKWTTETNSARGSSPIIAGKYLYRISKPGMVKCWEAATGQLLCEERTPGITLCSSPIAAADGRIYFASAGKSYVIRAGPKFDLLAVNDLEDGNHAHASPAVSEGRIFVKGKSYLWCIGVK